MDLLCTYTEPGNFFPRIRAFSLPVFRRRPFPVSLRRRSEASAHPSLIRLRLRISDCPETKRADSVRSDTRRTVAEQIRVPSMMKWGCVCLNVQTCTTDTNSFDLVKLDKTMTLLSDQNWAHGRKTPGVRRQISQLVEREREERRFIFHNTTKYM